MGKVLNLFFLMSWSRPPLKVPPYSSLSLRIGAAEQTLFRSMFFGARANVSYESAQGVSLLRGASNQYEFISTTLMSKSVTHRSSLKLAWTSHRYLSVVFKSAVVVDTHVMISSQVHHMMPFVPFEYLTLQDLNLHRRDKLF